LGAPTFGSAPGQAGRIGPDDLIRQLKMEQASLARKKKDLRKKIRNETRKRSRLREKAKKLSNDDLMKVLVARQRAAEEKNRAKAMRRG